MGLLLTIGGLVCVVYLLARGSPGVQKLADWALFFSGRLGTDGSVSGG